MSIIDSISESGHETIAVAIESETVLRAEYEKLSNAFWASPTPAMVDTLDKLLEVIEDVSAWRKDIESAMDNLDGEG